MNIPDEIKSGDYEEIKAYYENAKKENEKNLSMDLKTRIQQRSKFVKQLEAELDYISRYIIFTGDFTSALKEIIILKINEIISQQNKAIEKEAKKSQMQEETKNVDVKDLINRYETLFKQINDNPNVEKRMGSRKKFHNNAKQNINLQKFVEQSKDKQGKDMVLRLGLELPKGYDYPERIAIINHILGDLKDIFEEQEIHDIFAKLNENELKLAELLAKYNKERNDHFEEFTNSKNKIGLEKKYIDSYNNILSGLNALLYQPEDAEKNIRADIKMHEETLNNLLAESKAQQSLLAEFEQAKTAHKAELTPDIKDEAKIQLHGKYIKRLEYILQQMNLLDASQDEIRPINEQIEMHQKKLNLLLSQANQQQTQAQAQQQQTAPPAQVQQPPQLKLRPPTPAIKPTPFRSADSDGGVSAAGSAGSVSSRLSRLSTQTRDILLEGAKRGKNLFVNGARKAAAAAGPVAVAAGNGLGNAAVAAGKGLGNAAAAVGVATGSTIKKGAGRVVTFLTTPATTTTPGTGTAAASGSRTATAPPTTTPTTAAAAVTRDPRRLRRRPHHPEPEEVAQQNQGFRNTVIRQIEPQNSPFPIKV
jgi:hypothetical protein